MLLVLMNLIGMQTSFLTIDNGDVYVNGLQRKMNAGFFKQCYQVLETTKT